ncbi:MAG: type II toxin-antitoxin system HicB family antitoxin [Clostridia bacterium]|nr:type II toxin-antitoxin system HicB family antitoxin [Clostridia bacterium]
MKKLFYPAVFQKEEIGYSVYVPDIPGCNTQGDTLEEAYEMAFDAIGICVAEEIETKGAVPTPSSPETIDHCEDEFVVLIDFDFDEYCRKYDNRAVKKTLTIPAWLNTMAEKSNINFSLILQDALKTKLNLHQ